MLSVSRATSIESDRPVPPGRAAGRLERGHGRGESALPAHEHEGPIEEIAPSARGGGVGRLQRERGKRDVRQVPLGLQLGQGLGMGHTMAHLT